MEKGEISKKKSKPKRHRFYAVFDIIAVSFVLCIVLRVFFAISVLPTVVSVIERLPCFLHRFIPFNPSKICRLEKCYFSVKVMDRFILLFFNYTRTKIWFVRRAFLLLRFKYFKVDEFNLLLFVYLFGFCYLMIFLVIKYFRIRLIFLDSLNIISGIFFYMIFHLKYLRDSMEVFVVLYFNLNLILLSYLVCKKLNLRFFSKAIGIFGIFYWSFSFLFFQLGQYGYRLYTGYFMEVFLYALIYEMKSPNSHDLSIMKMMGYLNFFPSWIATGPLEILVYDRWYRNLEKGIKEQEREEKGEMKKKEGIHLFGFLKRHFNWDVRRDFGFAFLFALSCYFLLTTFNLQIRNAFSVIRNEVYHREIQNVSLPWFWWSAWLLVFKHKLGYFFTNSSMTLVPIVLGISHKDVRFFALKNEFLKKSSPRRFSEWNIPHVKFLRYCIYFPLKDVTSHLFAQVLCVAFTVILHSINDALIIVWVLQMLLMDTFKKCSRTLSRSEKWTSFTSSFKDPSKRSWIIRWGYIIVTNVLLNLLWTYVQIVYFPINVFNNDGGSWTAGQTLNHVRHGSHFYVEYCVVALFIILNFFM